MWYAVQRSRTDWQPVFFDRRESACLLLLHEQALMLLDWPHAVSRFFPPRRSVGVPTCEQGSTVCSGHILDKPCPTGTLTH